MPRIPIAEFQPYAASPQAPRINPGVLDAEFAAGRNVAGAVAHAASTMADIRQRAVQGRERLQLEGAKIDWDAYVGKFLEDRKARSDMDQWTAQFENETATKQAQFMPKNLSRRGQELYRQSFGLWKKKAVVDIDSAATARNISDGIMSGKRVYDNEVAHGNLAGANNAVDLMESSGFINAAQANELRQRARPAAQEQQIHGAMRDDPMDTRKRLEAGEWDAIAQDKRNSLIRAAKVMFNEVREKEVDDLMARIVREDYPTASELERMVNLEFLTKTQAAELTKEYADLVYARTDDEKQKAFAATVYAINNLDRSNPDDVYHTTLMVNTVPKSHKLIVMDMLKDRLNPDSPANLSNFREAVSILRNHHEGNIFYPWKNVLMVPKRDANGSVVMEDVLDKRGRPTGEKRAVYENDGGRANDKQLEQKSLGIFVDTLKALEEYHKKHPLADLPELYKVIGDYSGRYLQDAINDARRAEELAAKKAADEDAKKSAADAGKNSGEPMSEILKLWAARPDGL